MTETSKYSDPTAIAKKIHVPTYEEILDRIRSRYPRKAKTLYDKEMAALQRTHDVVISKTDFVKSLAALLDSLHPFYWRLIEIEFDRQRIHRAIKCVSKGRKMASRLFGKYRFLLMAAENKRELLRTGREARGRILSLFKKCRKDLDYLRDLVVFIQHLPAIDASMPTLIVAGAPSSGKSTLVRNATRAKPKVAIYPFTTTTIHIGHFVENDTKIQIIDTPGLLDRPFNEMNEIEKKAVAALKELDGVILFLVDVSPDAYLSVGRQFDLLVNIKGIAKGKPIYIAINKIDNPDVNSLEKAREIARDLLAKGYVEGVYETVTADKEKVYNLIKDLANVLTSRVQPRKLQL